MCELCQRSFIGGIAAVGTVGAIPTGSDGVIRASFVLGTTGTR
jgi:hypothetical protein